MKAKPSDYFGAKVARTLTLPTFGVSAQSSGVGRPPSPHREVAYNVKTLEDVAEESADRQRSLTRPPRSA